MKSNHKDVLIIGAGLSGIAAACHLQMTCPDRTFDVIEARENIGGTWDLFKYPGIRSDSDMYTLGFSFKPWKEREAIADGPSIVAYLEDTVREYNLAPRIRFGLRVENASWSSENKTWTVTLRNAATNRTQKRTCNFLYGCTGYYRYDQGYTPDFEGIDEFAGRVVHPQKWDTELDYRGKKVVVIGSGATAITLLPELAKEAASVTMLQRSPTYVMALPKEDPVAALLNRALPEKVAYSATRWKNVMMTMASYQMSRRLPKLARKLIMGQARELLDSVDVDTHFNPKYDPWDQRLCVVPDGDLFDALNEGTAKVVTDHIDHFTSSGIALKSGDHLDADIVVTATGLIMQLFGGATMDVDGEPVTPSECMMYKGMMLSGVPNFALSIGYTNASWTLKCELICEYVCRLLNHMKAGGHSVCIPQAPEIECDEPLIDLSAGYIQRSVDELPKQGPKAPWRVFQNYILDSLTIRHSKLEDGAMWFGG